MIGWPDNQLPAQSTCKVRSSGRVPGRGIRVQDTSGASQTVDIHYVINVTLDNAEVQQLKAVFGVSDQVRHRLAQSYKTAQVIYVIVSSKFNAKFGFPHFSLFLVPSEDNNVWCHMKFDFMQNSDL